MKILWVLLALTAAIALVAPDPALARGKHKHRAHVISRCNPEPARPWISLFSVRSEPLPNGCAPAVYQYGTFVGQDPDPNIRAQLRRDPGTGYSQVGK